MRTEVLVIGGGITGLFTALDLSLRGLDVALIEKGLIGGGTSGRMHNLIHSGARYVTNDLESAIECRTEGGILRKIAGDFIRDTGGLFVEIDGLDEFYEEFIRGLRAAGIEHVELSRDEALSLEPRLSKDVARAVWVPDAVVYPLNIMTSVALAAHYHGAFIGQYMELTGFEKRGERVVRAKVRDNLRGDVFEVEADVYVNAAGPWAGEVARMAGAKVEVLPTAGIMVILEKGLSERVINRLRPPSDGDIIVPFNSYSIIGTTATIVESVDEVTYTEDEVSFLIEEASAMIPEARRLRVKGVYGSIRPLVRVEGAAGGRDVSRKFEVYVHRSPENMVTALGGKFSTGRLIGEVASDAVTRLMGVSKGSKTRDYVLPTLSVSSDLREFGLPVAEETEALSFLRGASQTLAGDSMYLYALALGALIKHSRQRRGGGKTV